MGRIHIGSCSPQLANIHSIFEYILIGLNDYDINANGSNEAV